jgi:hypothetical protein
MANKAMRKQQPEQYATMAARFVDDPRSAYSTSTDPLVVDMLQGDVVTTTSSRNDDAHDADAACDWHYVWDEVR